MLYFQSCFKRRELYLYDIWAAVQQMVMTGIWDVDKQIKRDTDLDPATQSGTVENSRKLYQLGFCT